MGTGLSHDGSACLLKDGKICVAIEKERITRIKHDGNSDSEALQYCLDAEGITFDDVALVVQNANFHNFDRGNQSYMGVPRIIPDNIEVVSISHHLAHAYSVVGTSPFNEMAVLVVDGCGSSMNDCLDLDGNNLAGNIDDDVKHIYFEKDSYYLYKNGLLKSVCKDFSPFGSALRKYDADVSPNSTKHSIGGLYLSLSQYVFRGFEDPGKLMGLSPYGRPGVINHEAFKVEGGRVFVNYGWMQDFNTPRIQDKDLYDNFQYYADIAYWIQTEIERALLYLVKSRAQLIDVDNLGYAGGVALNAVANRKLLDSGLFKDIYIQPAAADNGLSLGCAFYGWLEVLKKPKVEHDGSTYFGRCYMTSEIEQAIASRASQISYSKPADAMFLAAEHIANGKVVAWFEKGSEFGPRALGHRSILADPRNPEMRNFINQKIKFREDFRPFAPSVLAEKADIYFDLESDSPYMVLVANVKPQWRERIPSVVHEDGSSRVQTVSESIAPNYYKLIRKFGDLTGIYMVLNTSLNKKGMPIAETPAEAISFFLESALDLLVIDEYVIQKRPAKQKPQWNYSVKF